MKFMNTKMQEGQDLSKHLNQILEIAEQLKADGEMIQDSMILTTILSSLPKSYEGRVYNLMEKGDLTVERATLLKS